MTYSDAPPPNPLLKALTLTVVVAVALILLWRMMV